MRVLWELPDYEVCVVAISKQMCIGEVNVPANERVLWMDRKPMLRCEDGYLVSGC